MMNDYLKTYVLTFKTKAPVFIGSGREISKKEYIFDQREGKISYIDIDKMYLGLRKMHLERQYENYLLNNTHTDLFSFLKENRISRQIYQSWILYSEPAGDDEMNSHSIKNVSEFVKGPDGLPYIPGSSIKGAFRTMLEVSAILRNQRHFSEMGDQIENAEFTGRRQYLRREQMQINQDTLHRELFHDENGRYDRASLVNDMMRGMYFADSKPLSFDNLCLCQKLDLNVSGVYKNLNVVRECIKPGTIIEMELTVDSAMCPYSNRDILNAVEDFYANCKTEFISKFQDAPPIGGNRTNFFLGGGAGYPSKTVLYAVLHGAEARRVTSKVLNNTLPISVRKKHGHDKDIAIGASPHILKCTEYGGRKYQMGACCILKLNPFKE